MKLWHCKDARSLRVLWTLEELGLDFELESMAFPPRFLHPGYTDKNILGTVPYFEDGDAKMTESTGICLYLIERYQRYDLGLQADAAEYPAYLNWLFHSDATLTFPQTIFLRYSVLERPEKRNPQVAADYRKWFHARLRLLDAALQSREYLCEQRFTIADIAIGYALYLADTLRIGDEFSPQVRAYLDRLTARPGFLRAVAHTAKLPSPLA